jgi:hypothetical protein
MTARRLRFLLLGLPVALLAGCFNPHLKPGFGCGEDPPGPVCPDGFYCDSAHTCQYLADGGVPPASAEKIPLGLAYPGLAAVPLDDGVVTAGWVWNGAQDVDEFQVSRFDAQGRPLEGVPNPLVMADFADVERDSLQAAGRGPVAVFAGRRGNEVVALFVTRTKTDFRSYEKTGVQPFAVAASNGAACLVRTFVAAVRPLVAVCSNGVALTGDLNPDPGPGRPFTRLAAALTSTPDSLVVIGEVTPDVGLLDHQLVAVCPNVSGQAFGAFAPAPGREELAPAIFYSEPNSELRVTWLDNVGLRTTKLDIPSCTETATVPTVYPDTSLTPILEWTLLGRGGATGGGAFGLWSLILRGGSTPEEPDIPVVFDWLQEHEAPIPNDHLLLTSPRAVADGLGNLFYFYFASDADTRQGWVKLYDARAPVYEGPVPIASDDGTLTGDYSVAPRKGGGFFVVFRDNPGPEVQPQQGPLPAYLWIRDGALNPVTP